MSLKLKQISQKFPNKIVIYRSLQQNKNNF